MFSWYFKKVFFFFQNILMKKYSYMFILIKKLYLCNLIIINKYD